MTDPWEILRHSWGDLRACGTAENVPQAIRLLLGAKSPEEAERAYWKLDNVVVVQGAVFEAALPTTQCLMTSFNRVTKDGRPELLEFLVQVSCGAPAPIETDRGNEDIVKDCIREISRGVCLFLEIIETGGLRESLLCTDLLGICATDDPTLRARAIWYLERLGTRLESAQQPHKFVQNWIDEISRLAKSP